MQIQKIESIKINGSNKLFNGYIYNISFSASNGQDKSKMTVNLISEDGNYSITEASHSLSTPYKINIGTKIQFDMFLVASHPKIATSGNLLELTFIDQSIILDKIYVGLYKRHGEKSEGNLIIVGTEIDRCNPDNLPNPTAQYLNPCNPCKNTEVPTARQNYIDCEFEKKFEILDVQYNFTELKTAILKSGLVALDTSFTDPNPKYKKNDFGTLREVLSSWCRDFGYMFFWEDGKIKFVNLRLGIPLDFNEAIVCNGLVELETSYSIEDVTKVGVITNYSRPGENETGICDTAIWLNLPPMVQGSAAFTQPLTIDPDIEEIGAGLGYYSNIMRRVYMLYNKYDMSNSDAWKAGKKMPNLGLNILTNVYTCGTPVYVSELEKPTNTVAGIDISAIDTSNISPFDPANSSKVGGLANNVASIKAKKEFYECCQLLDSSTQWRIVANPGAYFFCLAEYNDNQVMKIEQDEQDYASNFMGKYNFAVIDNTSVSKFFEPYTFALDSNGCSPSTVVKTGDISYDFLGNGIGQVDFVDGTNSFGSNSLSSLPFAKFLRQVRVAGSGGSTANSNIGFKLLYSSRNSQFYPAPGTNSSNKNADPIKNEKLLGQFEQYFPIEVAVKNNKEGKFLLEALKVKDIDSAIKRNDIIMLLCPRVRADDFRITIQNTAYYPTYDGGTLFDGVPLNKKEAGTKPGNQPEIVYKYQELKCRPIGNNSYASINGSGATLANLQNLQCKKVTYKTPFAIFSYFQPHESYHGVVVEKHKQYRKNLPKIQSIYQSGLPSSQDLNFAKLDINLNDITDQSLRDIKSNDVNSCYYDTASIKKLHEIFVQNLDLSLTKPAKTKSFRICGVDLPSSLNAKITNGLLSFSIEINDGGVFTTYEFGTRLAVLPQFKTLNFQDLNFTSDRGSKFSDIPSPY